MNASERTGPSLADSTPELRSLRRRLVAALVGVAIVVLAFEAFQSRVLIAAQRESAALNAAGRQRMLSQQIVKASALLELAHRSGEQALIDDHLEELRSATKAFARGMRALESGDAELGVHHAVLQSEEKILLGERSEALIGSAESTGRLLAGGGSSQSRSESLMNLVTVQKEFLPEMERVVARVTSSASAKASWTLWTVFIAGFSVLGIVGAIASLIVFPALRRLAAEVVREKLRAEQTLESARKKEAMLERVSHGIRSPMMSVLGYSDMLLEPALGNAERAEIAQHIRRSTKHLLALVHEVIDQAAAGAGRLAVGRVPCSPEQAVHEVVTMLRPLATTRKLALSEQIEASLPHAVIGDPIRLRQVLMQVIGNAIKFTPKGEIVVRAKGDPNDPTRALIEVRDSGRGMTATQLQQHGLTPETASAALTATPTVGLSLARSLVLLMGGVLTAQSTPGQGTTVRLSLTRAKESPLTGQRRGTDVGVYPWLVGNVLVAEDSTDSQKLIAFYLRKMGLESVIVPDGRQAVNNALAAVGAGNPFDMILMDMQMPSLDGYEATKELRQRGYKGVIVALTANALAGDREKCLDAGCNDYLTKPIERDVFVGTCARLLCKGEDPELRIAS